MIIQGCGVRTGTTTVRLVLLYSSPCVKTIMDMSLDSDRRNITKIQCPDVTILKLKSPGKRLRTLHFFGTCRCTWL